MERNPSERSSILTPGRAACPAKSTPPVGVPRRFGIGSLLVLMVVYSLVSAMLPLIPAICALGFLTLVAVLQMWAGQGNPARRVSQAAGIVVLLGVCLATGAFRYGVNPCELLALVLAGYMIGYAGGGLVAGGFLIAWWIDRWWAGTGRP